jgi:spermidine/putrescine transport system permease protein
MLCVAAGLPLAFFIAGLTEQNRNLALTLVIIPLWTNLLIRTYAWQLMLPLGTTAVLVGMTCDYLPFLVLPLYASVEKMDWSIAEAAQDLHAPPVRVFWHAILPQVAPGLVAGVILVFIPATGQFVIPDLLGGAKTVMLGNAIAQQFGASRDWPFGSAIAFLSMMLVMAGLWVYARAEGERAQETLL